MNTTRNLHIIAAAVHMISAVLLLATLTQRGWLIANEFSTCAAHVIGIYIWTYTNVNTRKKSEYRRRWIEYAITAGLLEVAILDTTDVGRITAILLLNAFLQLVGWIIDEKDEKYDRWFVIGFALLTVEIILIAVWSPEPVRTKIIYAVLYILFGVVQFLHKNGMLETWGFDEDHIYTLLSITTKIILTWTLVAHDWNDQALEWSVVGVFLAVLLIGLYSVRDFKGRLPR